MEAPTVGLNRTGTALVPENVALMLEAVSEFSPPAPISTLHIDMERQAYIAEADSVGSLPPPTTTSSQSLLLDKLGERLAFERTGTRLYDALITKSLAIENLAPGAADALPDGAAAIDRLREIRAEELRHFHLLSDAIVALGGDPTAQTPCADVTAAASIGLMQVITDPRTTVAQSLSAILTAELTDNAGWELLGDLATRIGETDLAEQCTVALEAEAEHLVTIRGWLETLLIQAASGDGAEPVI
jgi:hypothetical protein